MDTMDSHNATVGCRLLLQLFAANSIENVKMTNSLTFSCNVTKHDEHTHQRNNASKSDNCSNKILGLKIYSYRDYDFYYTFLYMHYHELVSFFRT